MGNNEPAKDRTEAVFDYLQRYIQEKGFPPSRREIRTAVGLSSTSSVSFHLDKLEALGQIRLYKNIARGIVIRQQDLEGGDA